MSKSKIHMPKELEKKCNLNIHSTTTTSAAEVIPITGTQIAIQYRKPERVCMTKTSRWLWGLILILMLFTAGCSSSEEIPNSSNNDSINDSVENNNSSDPVFPSVSDNTLMADIASTPENDMGIGLKNIKIDTTEQELTDAQKAVITYFDNDYLDVPEYEFLRRYPNIFQGAQLEIYGMVIKVLSMDNENYKLVLWLDVTPVSVPYSTVGEYVILNGKTGSSEWLMEDDVILANGRYTGVETVDIDGTSYTIPVVNVYNTYYNSTKDQFQMAEKFDYPFIKVVAESIFGKDIEIRDAIPGEDMSEEDAMMQLYMQALSVDLNYFKPGNLMDLVVELEDQSNANFKKFRFSKYKGEILDAKGPFDSGIERKMEFSADFDHFFLFTRNENLESLTLAYYDKNLKKIWEREFEGITSTVYDYTETNLYIVVNNELYIVNINTGEDVFSPSYVGEKKEIRKFNDGIIIVSANKSDGVMKVSLNGDIIWKTNLSTDAEHVYGLQLVNGNLILDYKDVDWNQHYCLIDSSTGKMLIDTFR